MDKKNKKNFYFLVSLQFIAICLMEMSGPFWPIILRDLENLSIQRLQFFSLLAYIVPIIFSILVAPFWGKIGDMFGHKHMVIRALLALSLTQYLITTVNSVETIIIYRALQGIFAGLIAASMAYTSYFLNDEKTKFIAILQSSTAAGIAFGPILGGLVSEFFNLKYIFYISSILAFILALCAMYYLLPDNTKSTIKKEKKSKKIDDINLKKEILFILLMVLFVQIAKMIPTTFFVLYVEEFLHSGTFITGILYSVTGFASLIFSPYWGNLFDKISLYKSYLVLFVLSLIAAISTFNHTLSHNIWFILFNRLIWGIVISAFLPFYYSRLLNIVSKNRSGVWIGYMSSTTKLGNLIGISLGSFVIGIFILTTKGFIVMSIVYLMISFAVLTKIFLLKGKNS